MKIAVTTDGQFLESKVVGFDDCSHLLIVTVENMGVLRFEAKSGNASALARLVVEHRCEAIITGPIKADAFAILADDGVTRYLGIGLAAEQALEAMEENALALIRNPEGTPDGCSGSHHSGDCSGHDHHDNLQDLNTLTGYVQ